MFPAFPAFPVFLEKKKGKIVKKLLDKIGPYQVHDFTHRTDRDLQIVWILTCRYEMCTIRKVQIQRRKHAGFKA